MVNLVKDSERGDLMAFDTIDVPFYVKRVFVVNNVTVGEIRGNHAHKDCIQALICLNGEVNIHIHGIGYHSLFKGQTLLIDKLTWSSQKYLQPNSELMVLCSHEYDKNDYITDFEEFKRLTQ